LANDGNWPGLVAAVDPKQSVTLQYGHAICWRDVVFHHCKPYSKLMWQTYKTGIKEIKPLSKTRKTRLLAAIHSCPMLAVKSAG
jgi:hypothetical protein